MVPGKLYAESVPCMEWLDSKGNKDEWVQYEFSEENTFDFAEVFWYENQGWDGGSKLPASWSLDYLEGDRWKTVEPKGGAFPIHFGKLDRIEFAPIKSKTFRPKATSTENRMGLVEFRLGVRSE